MKWNNPQQGWYVLNTDGAANTNLGVAGCGGLIRDCRADGSLDSVEV